MKRHPLCPASVCIAALVIAQDFACADGDSTRELDQVRDSFRLGPGMSSESMWLMRARGMTSMDTMGGIEPLFGGAPPTGATSWTTPRPGALGNPDATGMWASPLQAAVDPVRNGLDAARAYGLRTDAYEAIYFGAASDTIGGARSSFGNARLNIRADILLFRSEGEGMGRVCAQVRQNNFWPADDGEMTASTGASAYMNASWAPADTVITRLYYAQSFADDRVVVTAGKVNGGDFVGLNMFASDEATQYIALAFDGNDVLPYPFQFYTPGVAVQALPLDWLYLSGVLASADGATDPLVSIDLNRGMYAAAEASVLFEWRSMPGRVSVAWVGSDVGDAQVVDSALPEIWGNAWFMCAQYFLHEQVGVWAQYATAEEDVAALAQSELALGVTIDDCFGRKGDGFGLAGGWQQPIDPGEQQEQFLIESYYRLQATGLSQVTLDAQLLAPSATTDLSDPTLVATVRWVLRF